MGGMDIIMKTFLIILGCLIILPILVLLIWSIFAKKPSSIKMIEVKFNSLIPFKGYFAITWFGIMYIRNSNKERWEQKVANKTANVTLSHEMFHVLQAASLLNWWFLFYMKYIYYYVIGLFYLFSLDDSYKTIPFELESYYKQTTLDWDSIDSKKKISEWKKFKLSLKGRKDFIKTLESSGKNYPDFVKEYFII